MRTANPMNELNTKADKVRWIVNEREGLYPKTPVPLNHVDPYTLLVAVLLSAQCSRACPGNSPRTTGAHP